MNHLIRTTVTAVPRYEEMLEQYRFDRDFNGLDHMRVTDIPKPLDLREGADFTAARNGMYVKLVAALDCVALAWEADMAADLDATTIHLVSWQKGHANDLYMLLDYDCDMFTVLTEYGEGRMFDRFKRLRNGRYVPCPSGQYLRAGNGLVAWADAMPAPRFKVPAWDRSVPA